MIHTDGKRTIANAGPPLPGQLDIEDVLREKERLDRIRAVFAPLTDNELAYLETGDVLALAGHA